MKKTTKGILIVGSIGLATFGGYKLYKLKKAGDQLSIRLQSVKDIGKKGNGIYGDLTFKVDLLLVNPSDEMFSVEISSVKVLYNDAEMAYTVPGNKELSLEPKSQASYQNIEFKVPFLNIPVRNIAAAILSLDFKPIMDLMVMDLYIKVNGTPLNIKIPLKEDELETVGVVASSKRNIKDGEKYDHLFPKPAQSDPVINKEGSVEDTVKYMGYIVKKCHKDTTKLAHLLKVKGLEKTLQNVFDFCYNHIQYNLDKKGVEQLRRPARTWKDRHKGVDCDCFSIFIASILYNLNIPFEFRITKYNGKENFQHVYIIVSQYGKKKKLHSH